MLQQLPVLPWYPDDPDPIPPEARQYQIRYTDNWIAKTNNAWVVITEQLEAQMRWMADGHSGWAFSIIRHFEPERFETVYTIVQYPPDIPWPPLHHH